MHRVVTLPPGLAAAQALDFARAAARSGADAVELRTDLHGDDTPAAALASVLPVLASERGRPVPGPWASAARWVDRPRPSPADARTVLSHHADAPLLPDEAVALWRREPHADAAGIKHVEPLRSPADAARLLETQARLVALVGAGKATVLATGPLALPVRAQLARANAFDYLAATPAWRAAPGQRLLADAVREGAASAGRQRLGILGSDIAHSRSPRIHPQPFDRIDLPPDTDVAALLAALAPWYRGLAVTSPFKRAAAAAVGAPVPAVNTLVAAGGRFVGSNTDVAGADAVLRALGTPALTVLGDGGVADAVRAAGAAGRVTVRVLRRADVVGRGLAGAVLWSWPAHVEAPPGLDLSRARVAIVAYGAPARTVAARVEACGGTPLRLGPRWFVAQARAQRLAWGVP